MRAVLPRGIQGRLLLLLVLTLLPLLLLQAWTYFERLQTWRDRGLATEVEVAHAAADNFDTYVKDLRWFMQGIGNSLAQQQPLRTADTNTLLSKNSELHPTLRNLNWLSPEGVILASSNPAAIGVRLGARNYLQEILRGKDWAISDLMPKGSVTPEALFVIAQAIRDPAGALRGIMVAAVNPDRLGDVALNYARPHEGAYAIFDRRGTLVYRSPERRWSWQERLTWQDRDMVLRRARETGRPQAGITALASQPLDPKAENEWYAARVPVQGLGWFLGASRPTSIALQPIYRALFRDLVILVVAMLGATIVARVLSQTISAPLARLSRNARYLEVNHGTAALPALPTLDLRAATEVHHIHASITQLVERLNTRNQELHAQKKLYESVLETLPVGVFVMDERHHLLSRNQAFARIWSPRDAPNDAPPDLALAGMRAWWPETGAPLLQGDWPSSQAIASGTSTFERTLEIERADGSRVMVLVSTVPLRNESGRITGAVGVIQDITERKRMETQLQRAVRSRDEVLAVVSHDLKNPLGSIKLNTQLLVRTLNSALPGEISKHPNLMQMTDRILRASGRMEQLIQDLLDVARIEASGLTLELTNDSAAPLVSETVELLRPLAEERGITLRIEQIPEGCCELECDHRRMLQVFSNLVGNAIKFTPEGGTITISAMNLGDRIRFSVSDTGPGIPAQEQEHIFNRYWQPRRTSQKGVGLGLFIAKGIVEAHGGKIWVNSVPGQGATFAFDLPKTRVPAKQGTAA